MVDLRINKRRAVAATALLTTLCFAPNMAPDMAFAANMEELRAVYAQALQGYEDALDEQEQNAAEIASTEQAIQDAEQKREQAQGEVNETAVALYKQTRGQNMLVDIVLGSESFQDAVRRYDLYEKVEARCVERIGELEQERNDLTSKKFELEVKKAEIQAKVNQAKKAAEKAEDAIRKASHEDGDKYHQVQGNGENCGATAFIVGVNILRDNDEYDDNVEVWKGPGFNGDSTNALAARAKKWLKSEDLDDEIGVEEVEGDIHDADDLQELLEDGNVVVISSGSGSKWRYADNPKKGFNNYPDGHWVVFYYYDDEEGVFYCNDSGVSTKKGAGVPYTRRQMQQWLDGRGNHFATVLYTK